MPEISVCDSDNLVLVTRSEARRVSSGTGILLPTASIDFYLITPLFRFRLRLRLRLRENQPCKDKIRVVLGEGDIIHNFKQL